MLTERVKGDVINFTRGPRLRCTLRSPCHFLTVKVGWKRAVFVERRQSNVDEWKNRQNQLKCPCCIC